MVGPDLFHSRGKERCNMPSELLALAPVVCVALALGALYLFTRTS